MNNYHRDKTAHIKYNVLNLFSLAVIDFFFFFFTLQMLVQNLESPEFSKATLKPFCIGCELPL